MNVLFTKRAAWIGLPLAVAALFVLYLDYGHWMDERFLGYHEIGPETPPGSIVTVAYAPCHEIDEDGFHLWAGGGGSIHVLGQMEGMRVGAWAVLQGRLLEDGRLRLLQGRAIHSNWFKKYAGIAVLLVLSAALVVEFRRGWGTSG